MSEQITLTQEQLAAELYRQRGETLRRQRLFLGVILVILVLLLVGLSWFVTRMTTPADAPGRSTRVEGFRWVRSMYGWGNKPSQLLVAPTDVVVASDGTIWTVSQHRTLVAFSPDGKAKKVISPKVGEGEGEIQSIEGLGIDEDGNVYACEFANNKIMVFSPEGELLREWGVQLPMEVAVKDGRVAVAAAYGIGLFDTKGELIAKWGSRGAGETQVDLPHGIEIGDDGTIFVSDTQNTRLKAYDPSGKLLWTQVGGKANSAHESTKSSDAAFQMPSGMTLDANGRLVFVDPFEFNILITDPSKEGTITARYGDYGTQDGGLSYPTGISYDAERDYFVVADTTNNRLQVFTIAGSGNALRGATRRFFDGPWYLCSIPLALLLLTIFLLIRNRRRRDDEAEDDNSATAAPTSSDTAPAF